MDAQQFAYWLQGFAELSGDEPPTPEQWKSIREHLGLVFTKVTPSVGIRKIGDDQRVSPQPPIPNIGDIWRSRKPDTGAAPSVPPFQVECATIC